MPCRPIGPLISTASPGRTREGSTGFLKAGRPMPEVLMKRPSAFPFSTTLVSAQTMRAPLARQAEAMEARIFSKAATGEALLDDEADGEVERLGAHDRHVVDRAADRQPADVAAREEQGLDHEAVGGEHLAGQAGGVVHLQQQRVAQVALEHAPGQLGAAAAAAAVGQQHLIHRSPRRRSSPRRRPCRAPAAGRGGSPC